MSIESVMPSNHLILCRPFLLLPSVFPSIRVFSNKSALHIRWPKYWSFSFNISPSNEYSGLISFRMDWLDFLAVRGTLKSLLQHHSSKASILQRSAFFIVQQLGFLLRIQLFYIYYASQVALVVKTNKQTKNPAANPGDGINSGSIWKIPTERGAWLATVHRVTMSWTQIK